ncbi:MAG: endonuclease MutS2 [Bacteroidia bacterium]
MYPRDIEIKIGFDTIRQLLAEHCLSPMGEAMVNKMSFSFNAKTVQLWVNQTAEFKQIITDDEQFPADNYLDISSTLNKLTIEGLSLTEMELHHIRQICRLIEQITLYFKKQEEKYPALFQLYTGVTLKKDILKIIDEVIDVNGRIKPSASPQLLKITGDISKTERDIHKQLVSIFKKAKDEGWAGETDISIREGRLVIPIIAEHKRKIKGLVHDESNSGNILYIEPTEIVEANNNLRHFYFEKQRETERILREVTLKIMPWLPDLEEYLKKITITDFIRAKAQLAIRLNAVKPIINTTNELHLIQAFHPLLFIKLKKENRTPVPLDLSLNTEKRIMVISGPNAGGKSVALKTIALNQYMLQCGLLVCCYPDSKFTLFKNLMVDIGDGQSIDNNLSSYSSHLTAMKHFVNFADKNTFFFIDELGSGTDPQFGGAIGEAVLERLNSNKAFGVVTSHFSNIKNYAGQTEGFINGSMLYDLEKYEPLYTLVSGKPGSSFAIELAKKTGLNKDIIERAKAKAGKSQHRMEEILSEYEKDFQNVRSTEKRVIEKEARLNKLMADYEELKTKLSGQKADILNQAKLQAKDILSNTNKLIEKTVRDIKTANADPVVTKAIRTKLVEAETELKPEPQSQPQPKSQPPIKIEPGTLVKIKGYESLGKVLQVGKEKVLVEMGLIKSRLDFDQIEIIPQPKAVKPKTRIGGYNYTQISQDFSPRLDVRGMSTEEALQKTITAVDNALVLSVDKLWILHGKGDGILRKMIRENLRKISHVKKLESEHADFGGDGITIVELG